MEIVTHIRVIRKENNPLDFRLLGPLEIFSNGRNVTMTAPKPRQVISLLALRRNAVVRTAEIIDELWEDKPPPSAMTTLQTYIYKIRKILVEHGAENPLQTRPSGYMLTIPDYSVDLYRFEQMVDDGRALLKSGESARASETFSRALSMWRGPALADVTSGKLLSTYVTRLEEIRFRALELRIETDLRLGCHSELISELKPLIMTHPLHERFHATLMIALHRSGRRHEALDTYHVLRRTMVEELGLEPTRGLKQLYQTLLSADSPLGAVYEHHP